MREVQCEIKITVDRVSFRDVIVLKYSNYSLADLMQLVRWIEAGLMELPYNIEVFTFIGGYREENCMEEENDEE